MQLIRDVARKILSFVAALCGQILVSKRHFVDEGSDAIFKSLPLSGEHCYIEDAHRYTAQSVMAYFHQAVLQDTFWFGVKTVKNPCDFWIYQQLIYNIRPDVILEIGVYHGGSTLALAHLMDLMGHGRVIGIDIDMSRVHAAVVSHQRITLVEGDACQVEPTISKMIDKSETVLIIEDSLHTFENTYNILHTYFSYVSTGSYFIIEDSVSGHGLEGGHKAGPYEAIQKFIQEVDIFKIDREQERYFFTFNPKGFLKRIR
ncbi:MAG: CmcI family methyltransferase [Desulfovibrio sp.]